MLFKKLNLLTTIILAIILSSCSSFREFPVSDKTPGAELKVSITTDKYENNVIRIKTKYLVAPKRLNPSKSFYVVWIETELNGVMNVGRLTSKTSKTSFLRTLTPFEPAEVFITAEDNPLLTMPKGIEICRIDLSETDSDKEAVTEK